MWVRGALHRRRLGSEHRVSHRLRREPGRRPLGTARPGPGGDRRLADQQRGSPTTPTTPTSAASAATQSPAYRRTRRTRRSPCAAVRTAATTSGGSPPPTALAGRCSTATRCWSPRATGGRYSTARPRCSGTLCKDSTSATSGAGSPRAAASTQTCAAASGRSGAAPSPDFREWSELPVHRHGRLAAGAPVQAHLPAVLPRAARLPDVPVALRAGTQVRPRLARPRHLGDGVHDEQGTASGSTVASWRRSSGRGPTR